MIEQMSNPQIFETYGCVHIEGFLDPITVSTVSQYFENKLRRGEWISQQKDPTSKLAYYADPLVEVILKENTSVVEEACGKQLLPTYSYSRIYQPGESLTPHVDRPSCEISVSVSIAYQGEHNHLHMHFNNNPPQSFNLAPGSAIIYKGCEARHWRYPLQEGQLVVQFMLHYVDKHGPYADFIYDGRGMLGLVSVN